MITKLTPKSAAASIKLFEQFRDVSIEMSTINENFIIDVCAIFIKYVNSLTIDPVAIKLEEDRKKALAKLTPREREILGLK
jgi:hypothetical protein